MSDFAAVISQRGKYVGPPAGPSMQPLLRMHRDAAVLVAPKFPLKKYDVILYRRANGQYVLHRIIGVKKQGYVLCGDALWRKEFPILDDMVIGVMEGYFKDEVYHSCNELSYRIYSVFRTCCRPLRELAARINSFGMALKNKLRGNGSNEN